MVLGAHLTYVLVSGSGDTDNAAFTIVGRDLQIASKLNFEAKQTYSVRVRVTDAGGLAMEKAFSITVTYIADESLLVERRTGHTASERRVWCRLLTAVENGGAGRSKMV